MRFPHVISKSTLEAYTPNDATLELVGEVDRKILPENLSWDNELCPSLATLCIQTIAENFKEKQILDELPCADRDHLLEILPTDLPMELMVPLIEDEVYWKRRYADRYGTMMQRKPASWTWKSLYLERHIQKVIEQAQPQYGDEETLEQIINLCNPYVHRIVVTQLQAWKPPLTWSKHETPNIWPTDHINFEPILSKFEFVDEVDIIYGMKDVGTEFSWNMFKLSVADCRHLSRALLYLKNLRIFRLHRTSIDDERARALMRNIISLTTIVELDLSNCLIADNGALCIAKVLLTQPTLQTLVLANNKITETGAVGFGFALLQDECCPLEHLDLRLNPLGHSGTMGILRALVRGNKPKSLSLAACMFEDDTSTRIGQMVRLNESLTMLNVSSNYFDEAGSMELLDAMKTNKMIEWIDLRDTDVPPDILEGINKALLRNRRGLLESDSFIATETDAVESVEEEMVELIPRENQLEDEEEEEEEEEKQDAG